MAVGGSLMTMTDDRGTTLLSTAGTATDHEQAVPTGMQVKKRNGALEPVISTRSSTQWHDAQRDS